MKKLIILFTTLIFTFFWLNSASAEIISKYDFNNNITDSVSNINWTNNWVTFNNWVAIFNWTSNISNIWNKNLSNWTYSFAFKIKTPWKTWTLDNYIIDFKTINSNTDRLSINIYGSSYWWKLLLFSRWASWQNVYRISNFVL